jgi:hypothetical protein
MAIYARSDLMSVSVSASHGGCGATHSRPVVEGNPVRIWELTCPTCENHLRADPTWSPTTAKIPETFDEQQAREALEQKGELERQDALFRFLESDQEFKSQLTQLMGLMTGQQKTPSNAIPGGVECANGHANTPGVKFCGECGTSMSRRPTAGELPAAAMPDVVGQAVEAVVPGPVCADCGEPIVRLPGQRGALPKRCPSCRK